MEILATVARDHRLYNVSIMEHWQPRLPILGGLTTSLLFSLTLMPAILASVRKVR